MRTQMDRATRAQEPGRTGAAGIGARDREPQAEAAS